MKVFTLAVALLAAFAPTASAKTDPEFSIVRSESKDQVVLTGHLNVPKGTQVKNAVAFDADTEIEGIVNEDVVVFSGDVYVSGEVRGDVIAFAGHVLVAKGAYIGGDLQYGDKKPTVAPGATIRGDTRKLSGTDFGDQLGNTIAVVGLLLLIGTAVGSLLLGMILIWLVPRAFDAALAPAGDAIGPSIGWGLFDLIVLPIVAVLLLVTVVGIPLGLLLMVALLPLYAVGVVFGMWVLGRWIIKAPRSRYGAFAIGWLILTVASLVPFLGGLALLVAMVFGLGAASVAMWRVRHGGPGAMSPPSPAPAAP